MEPKTIHLRDYRPSPYLIDSVRLEVDIREAVTLVRSELRLTRDPDAGAVPLELLGEKLVLKSVKLDGKALAHDRYQLSNERLVILKLEKEAFTLEIENEIDPMNNHALEGFYQSGDQLCTQCEPEGFRKITYYLDRPDVMATFTTKMIADKARYPYLLSNGNRKASGDLSDGRHWVEWEDPFRKPSYLFAMVAGDFDVARDTFRTRSGREIRLELYVDKGNLHKTPHALESLKTAMKWDEDRFGLEYDLDIYMIVAVDSFNMGAMENKGLNIFNSSCTLADEKSATDHDFQNIQGIIGHEYFHNWTGNRVTCRDWFQLTLKEGLTVFRDQEFSADMLSRAVKRLEDVRLLKESQFAEDAGPLSHPIRPSSYIEINNFYTRTVYEKGAEVVRMIQTLIGPKAFRRGMDKYFELFDGKAVTTEDFVHAMELASGKDLTQFKNWYSRPGTPTLRVSSERRGEEFFLTVEQVYPPTTLKVPEGNVLHLPFTVALIEVDGANTGERTLEVRSLKETFSFGSHGKVIPSLNRGFSAPVNIEYPYSLDELLHLMSFDEDPYCRYEATQKVYDHVFKAEFNLHRASGLLADTLTPEFRGAVKQLLEDDKIDLSFKSYLLDLPTESGLCQEFSEPDFDLIHKVREKLKKKIGLEFQSWFLAEHERLSKDEGFEITPAAFGRRALRNQCLSYLVASGSPEGLRVLDARIKSSSNMTDEIAALKEIVGTGVALEHEAIQGFYEKWKGDSLVMQKWFAVLAADSPKDGILERLERLEKDPRFERQVPNYLRALYLQFAKNNLRSFHSSDGKGYEFLASRILEIDRFNPQVASRAASAYGLITKVDPKRQALMRQALKRIMDANPSRDTYEVISKYLAQ